MRIFFVIVGLRLAAIGCSDHASIETDLHLAPEFDNEPGIDNETEFQFVDSSFQKFYSRFISDSLFQLDHVAFPVSGNYRDYENEIAWTKQDWAHITIDLENQQPTADSVSIVQNDSLFFYGFYCLDCGFSYEMQFKKMNGSWKLTHRQENNY